MERLVIVPDEKLEPLVLSLKARLHAIAEEVTPENFAALAGEQLLGFLNGGMEGVEDHELLVWLPSGRALVVAWTTLDPKEEVVGAATAGFESGLLARVFASGNSERQQAADLEADTWTNLEDRRDRRLSSLAGSPIHLFGKCAGVLARAGYGNGCEDHPVAETAALLGRLVEDRIIRAVLGLEAS